MHQFTGIDNEPKQPHVEVDIIQGQWMLYHKYSVCDCCGGGMDSGYYFKMWFDYNYICSEECLLKMPDDTGKQNWTADSYAEYFQELEDTDDGNDDTYWTEWYDGCEINIEDCEVCQQLQYENGGVK